MIPGGICASIQNLDDGDDGLSKGQLAAAIVVPIIGVLLIALLLICFCVSLTAKRM